MPLANVTITIPKSAWIGEISTSHPDMTFRVVSTQYTEKAATGLIEISGDGITSVISRANDAPNIEKLDLLWKNGDKTIVQIETENPLLLIPISRVGIPLKTPFTISDGEVSWEIFTSHSKLSELSDEFEAMGITYSVDSVQEYTGEGANMILTDRQQEMLAAAFEAGYYDTPRSASLTQVAESSGIAKATCSDILHRAEGKIINRFMDDSI